ncbi:hypothetical protein BX666DRAFT_1536706 [Dichotomocladium elegans]|nr:hypothetical protein BX666DRAFT_1536706 [Dichotomocladium elegans]
MRFLEREKIHKYTISNTLSFNASQMIHPWFPFSFLKRTCALSGIIEGTLQWISSVRQSILASAICSISSSVPWQKSSTLQLVQPCKSCTLPQLHNSISSKIADGVSFIVSFAEEVQIAAIDSCLRGWSLSLATIIIYGSDVTFMARDGWASHPGHAHESPHRQVITRTRSPCFGLLFASWLLSLLPPQHPSLEAAIGCRACFEFEQPQPEDDFVGVSDSFDLQRTDGVVREG